MMTPLRWIRYEFFGFSPPKTHEIVEEIDRETTRLNGAVHDLSRKLDEVKATRERNKSEMDKMLDETLRALGVERK